MNTKINLITIFCLFIAVQAKTQLEKLRSYAFSYSVVDQYNRWTEWSEAEPVNVLINLDFDKLRFTVFSQETQIYDITSFDEQETDEDGDVFLTYYANNEAGVSCIVRIARLYSQNDILQFYVIFSDIRWVYYVNKL